MQLRAISSVVVVIVGLSAVIIGGPVFALLFIVIGAVGYCEFLGLVARINPGRSKWHALMGYAAIIGLGLAALLDPTTESLFALATIAVVAPLSLQLFRPVSKGAFSAWSLGTTGSLYLGFPIFAAIAVRATPVHGVAPWLTDLSARLSLGWDPAPGGLAWALIVILTTWVGDSVAYLVGRTWGKRKLAPAVSPNKTVEGAAGGLLGAICMGGVAYQSFGLGPWWLGMTVGGIIGVAGQIGDLAESFLKRQVGVKDSGTVIPGHGGVLDRVDALLFAFPAGYMIAAGFDRIAT